MVLTLRPKRRSVSEKKVRFNSALLGTRVITPEVCVNRYAGSQLIVVAWQSQLEGLFGLPEPEHCYRRKLLLQRKRRPPLAALPPGGKVKEGDVVPWFRPSGNLTFVHTAAGGE
ncbi:hypothetical protein FQA47_023659 [Oryzias melastigma]|uniref:Uncharacterized protein n=1 Tax=Oryzias melastigma TaxID=30732 RepID=A0A834L118_ORYME|nr:hypothetical protein FQA47_023659 [Oryzias melastigma]